MKKLLAIAALFAAMVFTGCSKDDDGTNSAIGAKSYSGPLVGSWEGSDSPTNTSYEWKFNSNGTYTEYHFENDYAYWYKASGNFYVSEDGEYLAILSLNVEFSDDGKYSVPTEYQYLEYHKILDVEDTTLTMDFFYETDEGDATLDFENIGDYYFNNSPITYTKVD